MPNVLANLFSWADGVKRRVSSPLQTIALGLQRGSEDLAAAGQDADVAYGRGGMNSVLVNPQQRAEAARRSAEFGANMGMAGATVWHGSPHKFDKFDSSKIGTGEGAQAYGHGLYLAENQTTAGTYAAANRGRGAATDGLLDSLPPGIQVDAMKVLNMKDGPIRDAMLRDLMQTNPKEAQRLAQIASEKAGNMYKVDLPDNAIARMLDWDKPLSQQAPEVQEALRLAGVGVPDQAKLEAAKVASDAAFDAWQAAARAGQSPLQVNALKAKFKTAQVAHDAANSSMKKTGADAYRDLQTAGRDWAITAGRDGQTTLGASQAKASGDLRAFGVPGIRYLDGGSRGAGQGSSNFVVFPGQEDILKILERNGVSTK